MSLFIPRESSQLWYVTNSVQIHFADVNAQNDYNQTPLHAAAYNGHDEVVKLLIDNGANPNLMDKDGNTPYVAAIRAVKLLRNHDTFCLTQSERMGPLWQPYS